MSRQDRDTMERRETHIELADNINRLEVAITKGFTESKAAHDSTKKELCVLSNQHEKITHAIYGNGKEGLVTAVAKLKTQQSYLISILSTVGVLYLTKSLDLFQYFFNR